MIKTHGLGGATDLPIPANLAITGGAAALVLSFAILLLAWRRPRLDEPNGLAVPAGLAAVLDGRPWKAALRLAGLAALGFTLVAAVLGQDRLTNPVFGLFYVWLWVGLIPVSLILGPVFRAISPVRSLHWVLSRLSGTGVDEGVLTYPARLGYWPAALGLFAFVWLELVYPYSTELGPVRLWIVGYLAVMLVGAAVFGEKWFERGDPFEVFSTVVSHLSPWGRSADGRLILTNPLRNLAQVTAAPGLVAVVAVLLGSTAYDSFRSQNSWVRFVQDFDGDVTLLATGALLVAVTAVGVTFSVATLLTSSQPVELRRRDLPAALAHSIVPIIVGYFIAHYLSFFVEYGQTTLGHVSDPLSNGADLFGTADREVNYWLSLNPTPLASIKVLAIVAGHILGAVAAHDRALKVLPKKRHVVGQLPLLAAMVLYTYAGLYLLFGT